jgi:predicted nucleic acid-binding protein
MRDHRLVVLDASVLINLLAMPEPLTILGPLAPRAIVPTVVAREVHRLARPCQTDVDPLSAIKKLVGVVDLTPQELELFGELVGAPRPDDLGDGEAAALAVAMIRGGACLVDDGKAIRVAGGRRPVVDCEMTVDLLRWSANCGRVGQPLLERSIIDALTLTRMRVSARLMQWVADVVHPRDPAEFPSLRRGWTAGVP